MKLKYSIIIDAPAEMVWRVLAHEFEHIDRWSSGVKTSVASTETTAPAGSKVCGRYCDNFQETFLEFDEDNMFFSYRAIELPPFVKRIENSWHVIPMATDKALVEIQPIFKFNTLATLVLLPALKVFGGSLARRTLEELKHFIENKTPHPRKAKQLSQVPHTEHEETAEEITRVASFKRQGLRNV